MQQREGRRSSKWRTGLEEMCLPPTDYVRVFRTGRVKITSTWAETGESAGIGPTILNFDQESPLELMVAELKRDHFASASTYENCSPSAKGARLPFYSARPIFDRSIHRQSRSVRSPFLPCCPDPSPVRLVRVRPAGQRQAARDIPRAPRRRSLPTLSLAVASRSRFARPPAAIYLTAYGMGLLLASLLRRLAASPEAAATSISTSSNSTFLCQSQL